MLATNLVRFGVKVEIVDDRARPNARGEVPLASILYSGSFSYAAVLMPSVNRADGLQPKFDRDLPTDAPSRSTTATRCPRLRYCFLAEYSYRATP